MFLLRSYSVSKMFEAKSIASYEQSNKSRHKAKKLNVLYFGLINAFFNMVIITPIIIAEVTNQATRLIIFEPYSLYILTAFMGLLQIIVQVRIGVSKASVKKI